MIVWNYILTIALTILLLFGCKQDKKENQADNETEANKVTIRGTIDQPKEDSVKLTYEPLANLHTYYASLNNQSGRFQLTFPLTRPTYINFYHKRDHFEFFAFPGDTIKFSCKAEDLLNTLQFTGEGATRNNYLVQRSMLQDSINPGWKNIYKLNLPRFKKTVDSFQRTYLKHLQSNGSKISSAFEQIEKAEIKNHIAERKVSYEIFHSYYTGNDTFQVPDGYYNFVDKYNLNTQANYSSPSYLSLIKRYLNQSLERKVESDSALKDTSKLDLKNEMVQNKLTNDTLQALVLTHILGRQLRFNGPADTRQLYQDLQQMPVHKSLVDSLQVMYDKWSRIAKGNQAPGFRYPSYKGDTVSLSDLKGKYVYIDVWATWCGPCLQEIPHLKKLEERFDDENIAFVNISVDKKGAKEKWKKMVANKDMDGYHLFANADGFDADKFADAYIINGLPRFILIGPNGKIIDYNAAKPSGDIGQQLNNLIEEENQNEKKT